MPTASWVIPVAVLAAICAIALGFVWWWFPRAWQKGINADMRRVDDEGVGLEDEERMAVKEATRAKNRAIIQRALDAEQARKRGEVVEVLPPAYDEHGQVAKPGGYAPV